MINSIEKSSIKRLNRLPVRLGDGVDELGVVVQLAQSQDLAKPHDDVNLSKDTQITMIQ